MTRDEVEAKARSFDQFTLPGEVRRFVITRTR